MTGLSQTAGNDNHLIAPLRLFTFTVGAFTLMAYGFSMTRLMVCQRRKMHNDQRPIRAHGRE
jgi:hypothetical protein